MVRLPIIIIKSPRTLILIRHNIAIHTNLLFSVANLITRTCNICMSNTVFRMGSRLEKYYLFCDTAFLSLFTMRFVRYIDI